jgi:hypothetical protein
VGVLISDVDSKIHHISIIIIIIIIIVVQHFTGIYTSTYYVFSPTTAYFWFNLLYCVRRRKDTIAEKKNKITVHEVCKEVEPSAPVNVAGTVALVGSIDSTEKGLGVRVGPVVIVGTPEGGFDMDGSADIDGNIELEGAVDGIPTTSDDAPLMEGTLLIEEAIDSSVGCVTGVIVEGGGGAFGTGYPLRMCKKLPAPSAAKHSNVANGLNQ